MKEGKVMQAKALRLQIEAMARQSGAILRSKYRQQISMQVKGDDSLVTEAECLANRPIVAAIHQNFPNDQF